MIKIWNTLLAALLLVVCAVPAFALVPKQSDPDWGLRLGMTSQDAMKREYLTGSNLGGLRIGPDGADYRLDSPIYTPTLFDDFLGDVIADQWSAAKGSNGSAVIATVNAGGLNGTVRQTTGATVVVAESCVSLTHYLNWKASSGTLIFEARVVPVSSVANVQYFIGLTDTIATGTLEQPFTYSGTTLTAVADDAVGFVYDTDATTDVFYTAGVKATVKTAATAVNAPVADTAIVLRVEVSTAGTAKYYVNGVLKATVANAVTPGTALTPVVEAMTRTTAVKSIDVDYIYVSQKR